MIIIFLWGRRRGRDTMMVIPGSITLKDIYSLSSSAICYCYGRGLPTSVSPCEVKSLLTNYYHDNIYYYLLALLDVIILLLNKRKLYLLLFIHFFFCCSVCRRPFRSLLCGLFGRFANKLFFSSHSRNTTTSTHHHPNHPKKASKRVASKIFAKLLQS